MLYIFNYGRALEPDITGPLSPIKNVDDPNLVSKHR
jgi:hypothetical protein